MGGDFDLAGELEYQSFELSNSLNSMTDAQWGFVVFTIMIIAGIILVVGKKSKGKTESFRETIRHDKRPIIGLFIVLPIFLIGYIWAFLAVFYLI